MKLAVIFIALSLPIVTQGQNSDEINEVIANLVAAFIENSGEEGDFDFNTMYEEFENLRVNPINLNKVNRTELQEMFFLNEVQISNFLDHRNKLGDLKNILELQSIPSFDLSTIRLLKEVAVVKKEADFSKKSIKSLLNSANNTVYLKWKRFIEPQRGFTEYNDKPKAFLGSPNHIYLRYKMNVGNDFKLGFIAEKDAGEPFYYPGKIYGADYFSFHAYAKDLTSRIKFLALGDYSISLGQGLLVHNGFGAGKSSLTTSIRKGGYPIRAYTSVAELNFLRGAAVTIKVSKKSEWTSFISSRRLNGSIQLTDENDPFSGNFINSIPLGGLNRTESEIGNKSTLRKSTAGTSFKQRFKKGHVALNGIADVFNVNLEQGEQLYQFYNPSGSILWNTSLDYGYNWRNINFFGEVAIDKTISQAHMHGMLIGLDKKLDLAIAYRNYSKSYTSLNSNAFGESQTAQNETGLYGGLEFRPSKMWIINAYIDHWKSPWAKFRIDGPSYGKEYFLKVKFFKKRTWEIYGQYFYEQKLRNLDAVIDVPVENTRQRFRLHGSYKLSNALELRNRIEWSFYDIVQSNSYQGFMMYQDVLYKPIGKNYSFNMRYAFFDVNNYDARIYAFENDILNEYYIPAYNGRGIRFYLNTRFRLTRAITGEFRYDITRLNEPFRDDDDRLTNNSFGSGNTFIDGRNRSTVKAQIKYSF